MPDPITTLGLGKTTSDIIKEALDFARKAKNSELAEKLIDLYQNFVQMSESNQELKNEIQRLQGQIAELNKRPGIAGRLRHVLSDGSYYLKEDDGKESGPFCTVCWMWMAGWFVSPDLACKQFANTAFIANAELDIANLARTRRYGNCRLPDFLLRR